jgi:wyosine [tRNA(Phe)-imidazoG37] synthetase (radical SAM superfamily)
MTELPQFFKDHQRSYQSCQYVYPVISRRSGGVSIGINLSPHKACNFDCLYCQVDRSDTASHSEKKGALEVDMPQLEAELTYMVEAVRSGDLFLEKAFSSVPLELRVLKDIALSGDGEPTAEKCFTAVCRFLNQLVNQGILVEIPLVLITNATMFHKPRVFEALTMLMSAGGVIWGKLDAGTDAYYQTVARSRVPFQRVLDNLSLVSQQWPIIIQTLFFDFGEGAPSDAEIEAYVAQLKNILDGGGQIKEVHVHTVARAPGNHKAEALPVSYLNGVAEKVRLILGVSAKAIGGSAA